MDISILYEDENYFVVNKPAGLIVHSDGRTGEETLAEWLLKKYPDLKSVGGNLKLESGQEVPRAGIAHRLDRETSGALIVAKNEKAFSAIQQEFKKRQVRKIYRAFVYGKILEKEGVINFSIGRSKKDFRMRAVGKMARGNLREALTEFQVFFSGKDFSFVELEPKTGRTHQIRVHMKAINHSVVSDSLYAPKMPPILGFKRLALHCFSLKFKNLDGKEVEIEAPYPADFEKAIRIAKITAV